MPEEIDMLKFLEEWFGLHEKPFDPKNHGKLEALVVPKMEAGSKFLLFGSVQCGDYPTIWGYFCSAAGQKLFCRHFYKSASEAAWRGGTGIRGGDSGWVKSAESCQGHESGGYIFEGMVPNSLETGLQKYCDRQKKKKVCTDKWWMTRLVENKDVSVKKLQEYFVGPAKGLIPKTDPNHIQSCYAKERQYVIATPEYLDEGVFDPAKAGELYKQSKKGSVAMQTGIKSGMAPSGKVVRTGLAHDIKRNTPLWEWVNSCLSDPVPDLIIKERPHEVLRMTHSIYTYRLKTTMPCKEVMVEIARTDKTKNLSYVTPSGTVLTVNSPVCWIRSVYVPGVITSFGTYRDCPIDLAFLVQKPCDYLKQTITEDSKENVDRLGVGAKFVERTREDGRKEKVPVFVTDPKGTGNEHIVQKSGRSTYLLLALFNETTSPLLKVFKDNHQLQRFRYKYRSVPPTWKDHKELLPHAVKGVQEYLDIQSARKKNLKKIESGHGDSGINRAEAFKTLINDPTYNSGSLLNDIDQLFAHNVIRGKSYGGWFNSIGTRRNSLFTIFIRNLLSLYLQDPISEELKVYAGAVKKMPVGPTYGVQRALIKAVNLSMAQPRDQSIEEWITTHSADLLKALKG